jgi:hypothetical protein
VDYEQRKGVAMGKAFAPAYANIFMAEWEQRLFSALPDDLVPSLWKRFIDDCLGTLEGSESDLAEFLHIANSIDPRPSPCSAFPAPADDCVATRHQS